MPARKHDSDSGELVLVGGAYKSGTSALCATIEADGFRNPASLTNPNEFGHGRTIALYPTRECSVARAWNRMLVSSSSYEALQIERKLANYLIEMKQHLGARLVIKDPYIRIVSPHWVNAAKLAGIDFVCVLITKRNSQDVLSSQEQSRFMRLQNKKYPDVFQRLLEPVDDRTIAELRQLDCKLRVTSYEKIIN